MEPRPRQVDSESGHVTLRYWASLRAAAGVAEDRLEVAGAVTLADLTTRARALHASSERFAAVLGTCSVLVADRPVASADPAAVLVEPGESVEFLPPFAGG
ncbi:MoaD/ThiS family protein [Marmoricola sp. RAF53]|uniref:MoaD/ThiS family protein n=1 Tax=Marmoricola sp. RAF53 TaxID=3233059 RepID=UPI003F9D59CF